MPGENRGSGNVVGHMTKETFDAKLDFSGGEALGKELEGDDESGIGTPIR